MSTKINKFKMFTQGGSWFDSARILRAAFRFRFAPSNRWYYLGFRTFQEYK